MNIIYWGFYTAFYKKYMLIMLIKNACVIGIYVVKIKRYLLCRSRFFTRDKVYISTYSRLAPS